MIFNDDLAMEQSFDIFFDQKNTDDKIYGTISYSPMKPIKTKIFGRTQNVLNLNDKEGVIECNSSQFGNICLLDSYRRAIDNIESWGLINYSSEGLKNIKGFELVVNGLNNWVFTTSGFTSEQERLTLNKLEFNLNHSFTISDKKFSFSISNGLSISTENNKKFIVEQYPIITFKAVDGYIGINEVYNYIIHIVNFFSLLTGFETSVRKVNPFSEGNKYTYISSLFPKVMSDKAPSFPEAIVNFNDVCADGVWEMLVENYFGKNRGNFEKFWCQFPWNNQHTFWQTQIFSAISLIDGISTEFNNKNNKTLDDSIFSEYKKRHLSILHDIRNKAGGENKKIINSLISYLNKEDVMYKNNTFLDKYCFMINNKMSSKEKEIYELNAEQQELLTNMRNGVAHGRLIEPNKDDSIDFEKLFYHKIRLQTVVLYLKDFGFHEDEIAIFLYNTINVEINASGLDKAKLHNLAYPKLTRKSDKKTMDALIEKKISSFYIPLSVSSRSVYKFYTTANDAYNANCMNEKYKKYHDIKDRYEQIMKDVFDLSVTVEYVSSLVLREGKRMILLNAAFVITKKEESKN